MTIEELELEWERLGDVPVTDDMDIDEDFEFAGDIYEKGTDCHEIWSSFEEICITINGKGWFEYMGGMFKNELQRNDRWVNR